MGAISICIAIESGWVECALVNTTTNKTYTFLVCLPSGAAEFADIVAQSSADAVRQLVAKFGRVRANIINIY